MSSGIETWTHRGLGQFGDSGLDCSKGGGWGWPWHSTFITGGWAKSPKSRGRAAGRLMKIKFMKYKKMCSKYCPMQESEHERERSYQINNIKIITKSIKNQVYPSIKHQDPNLVDSYLSHCNACCRGLFLCFLKLTQKFP